MKAFNLFAIAIFIGVVGFITYHLIDDSNKKYYTTEVPQARALSTQLTLSGYVYPDKEVEIKPQISGVINEIYVSVGDFVKEGDPIASINIIASLSEIEQLESNLRKTEITLKSSEQNFNRIELLYQSNAISRADYEIAERDYNSAYENYTSALKQVRLRQTGQPAINNIVRASTEGVVIDIPVNQGSSVIERSGYNPGTTIASIASNQYYVFKANVSEMDISNISLEMPMKIRLPMYDDICIDAIITKIARKGELNSGVVKFPIEAEFKLTDAMGQFRSGYSGTALITTSHIDSVLTLSERSIHFRGDTTFVYVTDSLKKTQKEKVVSIGASDGEYVEIKDGVNGDNYIITNYYD